MSGVVGLEEGSDLEGQAGEELSLPVVETAGQSLGDTAEGLHQSPPAESLAGVSPSSPRGSIVARRP